MPKKDELICTSEGCYSDYGYIGHFRVLEDFSMKALGEEFLNTDLGEEEALKFWDFDAAGRRVQVDPPQKYMRPVKHGVHSFQAFLIRKGLIEDIDVREYHLGAYGFEVPKED